MVATFPKAAARTNLRSDNLGAGQIGGLTLFAGPWSPPKRSSDRGIRSGEAARLHWLLTTALSNLGILILVTRTYFGSGNCEETFCA